MVTLLYYLSDNTIFGKRGLLKNKFSYKTWVGTELGNSTVKPGIKTSGFDNAKICLDSTSISMETESILFPLSVGKCKLSTVNTMKDFKINSEFARYYRYICPDKIGPCCIFCLCCICTHIRPDDKPA